MTCLPAPRWRFTSSFMPRVGDSSNSVAVLTSLGIGHPFQNGLIRKPEEISRLYCTFSQNLKPCSKTLSRFGEVFFFFFALAEDALDDGGLFRLVFHELGIRNFRF